VGAVGMLGTVQEVEKALLPAKAQVTELAVAVAVARSRDLRAGLEEEERLPRNLGQRVQQEQSERRRAIASAFAGRAAQVQPQPALPQQQPP